jgi:hypothetical protein
MSKLKLYRGDGEKISQFEFSKTSKYCLYGRGIYLTTEKEVAETYRKKGLAYAGHVFHPTLFVGGAANRLEAMENAFSTFAMEWAHLPGNEKMVADKQEPLKNKKVAAQIRDLYRIEIEEKRVVAEYFEEYVGGAKKRHLKVTWTPDVPTTREGYITAFEFPEAQFNSSVVHMERKLSDRQVAEILYENQIGRQHRESFGTYADRLMGYLAPSLVQVLRQTALGPRVHYSRSEFDKIRSALQPYGYLGFEYCGGIRMGHMRHRAFVIWDDQYVNQHRVNRWK